MTRRLPKYVQGWVDRKGRSHHYFRRRGYPRVRLPGLPWSPSFMVAYEAAMGGPALMVGAKRTKSGTLHAAVAGYFTSLEFRSLKPGTQSQRRTILQRFDAKHGDKPVALLPLEFIRHVMRDMKPHAADNFLKALRHLLAFCVEEKFITADPTRDIKHKRAASAGFHTWTEDEICTIRVAPPCWEQGAPRVCLAALHRPASRRCDSHGPPAHQERRA